MKKELIIGIVIAFIIGLIVGIVFFPQQDDSICYNNLNKYETANSPDKMKLCEIICAEKGLFTAGYEESNLESDVFTMQKSYDYSCDCLAQPMTLCETEGDSACVNGVGYCDISTNVCVPIKK